MTITYRNGRTEEALILSRTDTRMRVVLHRGDDVLELQFLSGAWVTEDCEPVTVQFAARRKALTPMREEDYVCSTELASHLIHLLLTDSSEDLAGAAMMQSESKDVAAARVA